MPELTHLLERTLVIEATRTIVFQFFTDTARWAAWWGAGSVIDARPGGRMLIRYANGVQVDMELEQDSKLPHHGPMGGAIFIGENGKIEINRNEFHTNPKNLITNAPSKAEAAKWNDEIAGMKQSATLWQAKYHIQNWMDCVKTREKPFRDIELAVNTMSVCHLGGIAYRLQKSLQWDAANCQFIGDEEANRMVDRARREPWQL